MHTGASCSAEESGDDELLDTIAKGDAARDADHDKTGHTTNRGTPALRNYE